MVCTRNVHKDFKPQDSGLLFYGVAVFRGGSRGKIGSEFRERISRRISGANF